MNKIEKIVLCIGLLLWVVGDFVTTWYGFTLGLKELNPITHNLFQIAMLKIGVVGAILIVIDFAEKKNLNFLKTPVYTALISVGAWAVQNNIIAIIGAI